MGTINRYRTARRRDTQRIVGAYKILRCHYPSLRDLLRRFQVEALQLFIFVFLFFGDTMHFPHIAHKPTIQWTCLNPLM
jgi:hypothetical protein